VEFVEQAMARGVVADHAGEIHVSAERPGVHTRIGRTARNGEGIALAQHKDRSLTRDLQRSAKDIFIGHHVTDDQQAFAGELADEARQPIALGGSSHEDDFLTSKGRIANGRIAAPHTSIAWRLSRRALLSKIAA
jgi:superfamily II DNA/RNA helicase